MTRVCPTCRRPTYATVSPGIWKCPKNHVTTMPLSGITEGRKRRDDALDLLEDHKPSEIEQCRTYARELSKEKGIVTADDVRSYCDAQGIARGPWLGSIFRGAGWEMVGWTQSTDPVQHATGLRQWRWIG